MSPDGVVPGGRHIQVDPRQVVEVAAANHAGQPILHLNISGVFTLPDLVALQAKLAHAAYSAAVDAGVEAAVAAVVNGDEEAVERVRRKGRELRRTLRPAATVIEP